MISFLAKQILTLIHPSKIKSPSGPGEVVVPTTDFPAGNKSNSDSRRAFLGSLCDLPKFQYMVERVRDWVLFLHMWKSDLSNLFKLAQTISHS